jgi:hypothetical protein
MKTWSFEDRAIDGSEKAFALPLKRSVSVNANAAARTSAGAFGGFLAAEADAVVSTIVARTRNAGTTVRTRCLTGMYPPC